jgi:hypothetical protein
MKKKFVRYFAFFMAINILAEVVSPTVALALTSGHTQPEYMGFEPANSSEMIDLFTGDFKYNIPLMDVDGYPLNLAYHAGQNMESEASWVGLGWSLNPGVLNRNVKGLPDDFKGEELETYTNVKPFAAMGVGYQFSAFIGPNVNFSNIGVSSQLSANGAITLNYNNYKGFGLEVELDGQNSISASAGIMSVSKTQGVGMKLSSQDGGTLSQNHSTGIGVNFSIKGTGIGLYGSMGEGTSVNTRSGAMLKTSNQSLSASASVNGNSFGVGFTVSHTLPAGSVSYVPSISNNYKGGGFSFSYKAGLWGALKPFINFVPVGGNIISGGAMLGFKGYYNLNKLESKYRNAQTYGYLYSQYAPTDALMDFNRFRDGVVMDETPNINLTASNYDILSASGQGMGGAFRPFRSDIGVYHDNVGKTKSLNVPVETELGGIFILHFLLNTSKMTSAGQSGVWNTLLNNSFPFTEKDVRETADRFYEKYYFKQMGEIAARDGAFDASVGGEAPVSPYLLKQGNDYHGITTLAGGTRTKRDIRNTYMQSLTASEAAKYGFEPTYKLYSKTNYTVDPSTRLVTPSNSSVSRLTKSVPTTSSTANVDHHLSEISLTNPVGSRYIYGIPTYNLYRKKVVFNASERTETAYQASGWPLTAYTNSALPTSESYQFVQYDSLTSGKEIINNLRGQDNFYRHEITKPYATGYLLTNILSSDYVDITGDGPSYDDFGNFTRFNYYKEGNYGWREPFCLPAASGHTAWSATKGTLTSSTNQANLERGLLADKLDDKAFYEYGLRENYYMHSIESKNYVAFFETSQREDALGVDHEHGASSSPQNLKLDYIKLYSKSEIIAKGGVANAVPIKTIKFEYDYSLCPNTFNSNYNGSTNPDRGKLTLKKVFIYHGNSERSALSPYEFTYGGNFDYDPKGMDRWGSVKPNNGIATGGTVTVNNIEFPYAIQTSSLANAYSAAWNMTEVKTPTGAKIKVSYESDDYGYVQDEQAGQMLKIKNIVNSVNPTLDVNSYGSNSSIKDDDYLIVDMSDLHTGIPVGTYSTYPLADNFLKKNVIKPSKELYFKCFVRLAGADNSFGLKQEYWDFISGYAEVEEAGVFNGGISLNTYVDQNLITCYRYAYVKVKKEIAWDSKDVNPISLAGWDYLRNFLPRVAYPGSEPANMGNSSHKPLKQFTNMLVGLGVALADFVNGVGGKPNKRFYKKNFCNRMIYDKSFVRAYVPFKKKLGGGYRVSKIVTEDNWSDMTSSQETETSYGQKFTYTTTENKMTISSGVALYEPLFGGDENSMRQPIDFEIEKVMAPNDHFFQETPYGEMLYPAPLVGYSKVTVTPLANPSYTPGPTLSGIGKIEYEFYTAKDFPIIYQKTGVSKELLESDLIEDFILSPTVTKIFHATQGHLLKFNDMHGKLKSILNYGQDNMSSPISGTRHFYKQSGKNLVTSVQTINEKNQIGSAAMSRDIELSIDTRENINESVTLGNSFLLEIGLGINFVTIPACCIIVLPLPYINNMSDNVIYGAQKTGVRTAAMTKIVQQYGILDKVENFDEKSKVSTENLLWDRNTGSVVLTKTTNNLDQPVYSLNYPAYWMYKPMGHEFSRDGIELACPGGTNPSVWDVTTGSITISGVNNPLLLDRGDEVMVLDASNNDAKIGDRFWVIINPSAPNTSYLLCDQSGIVLNTSSPYSLNASNDYVIKVIRPINRNNLTTSAGYVTSLVNPAGSSLSYPSNAKIVNAFTQEFCTGSGFFLNPALSSQSLTNVAPTFTSDVFNPYTVGLQGNLRPSKSLNYSVDRSYGTQPNVSSDGFYTSFSPYWTCTPGSAWTNTSTTNWVVMNNNKFYSPFGQLLETVNGIQQPQAQQFGFNHTLPSLSATNAHADEVGFDSFEDYTVYGALTHTTNVFNNDHLGFYKATTGAGSVPNISNATAHTGKQSLYFSTSRTAVLKHNIYRTLTLPSYYHDAYQVCNNDILDCSKLNLKEESNVLTSSTSSKKYVMSMWIKGATQALDYQSQISLAYKTTNYLSSGGPVITTSSPTLVAKTGIINGWQKLDYEISVPASNPLTSNAVPSTIEFTVASTSSSSFYLDDFRIQPYNSTMTCYVYDPNHLRVWAQLDDRNYATIMEYNREGILVRRKKETLKGIYTLQESSNGTPKN